jgi:hypothetical protein
VRSRKAEIVRRVHAIPEITFDQERRLTSFSGLVLFQALFTTLGLHRRLRNCFAHLGRGRVFGLGACARILAARASRLDGVSAAS